jgi:hypothetical protein
MDLVARQKAGSENAHDGDKPLGKSVPALLVGTAISHA